LNQANAAAASLRVHLAKFLHVSPNELLAFALASNILEDRGCDVANKQLHIVKQMRMPFAREQTTWTVWVRASETNHQFAVTRVYHTSR
jgi:hypothetical protein